MTSFNKAAWVRAYYLDGNRDGRKIAGINDADWHIEYLAEKMANVPEDRDTLRAYHAGTIAQLCGVSLYPAQ
jgi:hypothetical protein